MNKSKFLTRQILAKLLLAGLWVSLFIQLASAQYRFDSWTTDNGLPQNGVRSITQTPDGYLWFTTFDGLVRFDGVKFTVFDKSNTKGIINNRFWVVYGAANGTLWAGTEFGDLTIYRNGVFATYPAAQVPDEQILNFLPDTTGEILIETEKNFYYLRGDEFIFAKPRQKNPETSEFSLNGSSGAKWTVSKTETTWVKDAQTEVYPLNIENPSRYGISYFEDSKGGLWVGDFGRLYYLKNGIITDYSKTKGFPAKTILHRFWEESDGSIWFATGDFNLPGVGLVRFKDGKFDAFGPEQGLSNDRIFDVFKDREGTIWLATDRGLNRLRRQVISSLSKKDGLAGNEIYPILKARDGSIYIGSTGGLNHYKDGSFTTILPRFADNIKTIANIQSLSEDADGRIWVGASGGLFVIENGVAKNLTKSLNYPHTISAIHPDQEGNIWLATQFGVIKYRDEKIIAQYTVNEGLAGNDVKAIHESSDGSLWFATYGGLSRFKNGEFTNYTTKEGLASNFVRSIQEDADGTMWIGTYDGGLSRLKEGKFFNFNTENGLFNNGVFATVEDKNGNFWISSNKGIYRVNKQQLNDFAAGNIANYESFGYGKQDGMLNTECNGGRQPSAATDTDGRIWFPTLEGVAIVNPDNLTANPLPPPIQIESVEIDRENVIFNETIQINPNQTYLDINYTALSFIKSDQIRFRHKLEGVDQDWVDAGTRRTVNYSFLPPGEYVFRVTATNTDGVWNTEGKSIKIVVLTPFYKTWWFFVGLILGVIAIGFLIYRNRINQLQRINAAQEAFSRQLIESQEAERKRIAQELHDGLGQNLLVIKNRALLGLKADGKDKTDEQFGEIQESVTDALSEVRSIAYNLRPLHLERLGLTATIEEMIEQIDETSNIQINCDIEPIDSLFTKENEINFYRIVQECLNNIVKHSNATKASVELFRQNQEIVLKVRDNGNGFDEAKIKQGLGLNGIAERVKILGGTYSIESEIDKGTTVFVSVAEKFLKDDKL